MTAGTRLALNPRDSELSPIGRNLGVAGRSVVEWRRWKLGGGWARDEIVAGAGSLPRGLMKVGDAECRLMIQKLLAAAKTTS
ncbi:hypothetical protein L596_004225 [Steinernema carpocapsae]|uniref:Uncharacterized protein n=1 Tax=Steinernema carpocapsae TaxID=34508 RepID=A0A4U8UV93_STECR|nr:hypothetical protein L596_004225 [Steinernema carpocapsae]